MSSIVCEICGKELRPCNYSKHKKKHEEHPETFKIVYKPQHDGLNCQFCNKECKNLNSLTQHEIRCKNNPDRICVINPNFNGKNRTPWNKGLTSKTDDRVAKSSIVRKRRYESGELKGAWSGKKHTEEQKKKISESRKRYLSEHPDKVPYLINHSSKISYPEQYFIDLFQKENIDLKYHLQVSKYQLDFYNEDKKLDVEIDGDQHYLDSHIFQSDRERDNFMQNKGWIVYRIRWSAYQKMKFEDKQLIIQKIKDILQ